MAAIVETASGLALAGLPSSVAGCLEQVQELVFARDRLISAIAARVEWAHRVGAARSQGHASTRMWLRGGCGTSSGSASRLVVLATELARLPVVRVRFAEGSLSEGQVSAICAATSGLTDEQAGIAEPILVGLADRASPAEVAKAGWYLRELLDPGQAGKEGDDDYGRRFLVVRPTGSGGLEGEFRLPREAAARLRTWLDAYAKPRVEGDERPLRVRNADALIALLENKITTELLVLVNAESLPKDHPARNDADEAGEGDHADKATVGHPGREPEFDEGDSRHTSDQITPNQITPDQLANGQTVSGQTDGAHHRAGQTAGRQDTRSRHTAGQAAGGQAMYGRQAAGHAADAQARAAQTARGQTDPSGPWGSVPGRPGLGWTVPGLLLATGQLLSQDDINRLARTSSLVRMVMDADGQVLDMGRAVRLATGAQRRAVYARYATCWIDGCPLPATLCQIDHADNWVDGGMTDLRLLGPACQFHDRDRYRHPDRYQRRREGKDRWAYTYTGRRYTTRRSPSSRASRSRDTQDSASAGGRGPNAP
ncbi:HNH endonuclease signature motif containing protein [Planotetraspora silvatica]|uniref:HNH endonuclease signature motif containing protein n=1 Tax=Planotetraspora silvatica TaxID=234614 RepID=UPI00194EF209|nr:HNH endonuclease signature motif containing protein [Planotetraspora silvatica]